MSDRFLTALDRLEEGRKKLVAVLSAQGKVIAQVRRKRAHGSSVSSLISSARWRELQDHATEAVSSFVSALAKTRAVAVWTIAEEEGASLSGIARMTGNARQVISRLYRSAREEFLSSDGHVSSDGRGASDGKVSPDAVTAR